MTAWRTQIVGTEKATGKRVFLGEHVGCTSFAHAQRAAAEYAKMEMAVLSAEEQAGITVMTTIEVAA